MPRLPVVTGAEVLRALRRGGFTVQRQSGSHVIIHHRERDRTASVPLHSVRTLSPGLLHDIIKQAGLTVNEFRHLLK